MPCGLYFYDCWSNTLKSTAINGFRQGQSVASAVARGRRKAKSRRGRRS